VGKVWIRTQQRLDETEEDGSVTYRGGSVTYLAMRPSERSMRFLFSFMKYSSF
jgi:hypothetical protein